MTTLSLGENGALPGIATIRQTLADAFAGDADDEIVLDAGDLAEADFSLVQLLEAARRHAVAHRRALRLAVPTGAVLGTALARAGVTPDTATDPDFWFHGAHAA